MSGPRPDVREQARAAIRGLSSPAADPGFRERLGQQFAEGDLPLAEQPRAARLRPWLAAAAVVLGVFATFLLFTEHGPSWQVANRRAEGTVEVDGVVVPHSQLAERALRPGTRIRVLAAPDLELVLPGTVALQITPGTEMTLPGLPRSLGRRGVVSEFVSGEARVTSGAGFAGARFRFRTPEAHVEVTGTTLAVIRDSVATCVCVFEGTVRMGLSPDALTPVAAGSRRSIYRDGRPPFTEEIRPMERMKLDMLRDRGVELMGPIE
ncbi:MAG: FecR domain-containing protein [Candidatus Eiseniibacteriota bacterium]